MQTREEIIRIGNEWAAKSAPKGLVVDETPDGLLNGEVLKTYLENHSLPFSSENLSIATEAERNRLNWLPGFEPKIAAAAPTRPKGSRFNQLADAGVRQFRAPGDTHADRLADAARIKEEAERQRQTAIAKQKEIDLARQQHAEETQILYRESGPRKGEVDHARTAGAQSAAKEKWAKIRGVATAKPSNYRIPLHPTKREFLDGTPAELRAWSNERKEAGLPASISW